MTRRASLRRDQRGAGIVEFALAAPLLFLTIIGIAQLGILFFSNAGLSHAVAEGARLAAIFPRTADDAVADAILQSEFGLKRSEEHTPEIQSLMCSVFGVF